MTVRDEQILLYRLGFDPGAIDGIDGPKTEAARKALTDSVKHYASPLSQINALKSALPKFIQAKNYRAANRPRSSPIDLLVIHTMEAKEKPAQAIGVARWFAGELAPTYPAPMASAHYNVDAGEVVQSVLECDVAFHAPGANHNGIGIEHAGFASQTPEDWEDEYSKNVLARSAALAAKLCLRFSIPVRWLTPADLGSGARGICGHVDVTNAFSHGRGHTDPGPSFPRDAYLADVSRELRLLSP
jgi:N-acetyl-anhydromuramyl-L-alanine amidase AmpD